MTDHHMRWFAARLSIAVYDTNAEYYRQLWEDEQMALKLQGLGAKMALLRHNLELDAEKLSAEVDATDAERLAVMPQAAEVLAGHKKDLAEVKSVIAEVKAATNGEPSSATTPPPVRGYPQ